MALEAIKVITGVGTPLFGSIGYCDSFSGQWEYIPVSAGQSTKRIVASEPPRHIESARRGHAFRFPAPALKTL